MAIKPRDYLYQKFQDGDIPDGQDFQDMIDSSLSLNDDGLTSYKAQIGLISVKRFGIGVSAPEAPLGIRSETGIEGKPVIQLTSDDDLQDWIINLDPSGVNTTPGLSIANQNGGTLTNVVFIDHNTNNVGIGTTTPSQKLSIEDHADSGFIGLKTRNLSAVVNEGFLIGHVNDTVVGEHDGSLAIYEENSGSLIERITVRPATTPPIGPDFYNVGVNTPLPYSTLHVSRDPSDPASEIALSENTGIFLVGVIDDQNIGMDGHNIQARTGSYPGGGTTLGFTATTLDLQPLGGDILIHGTSSNSNEHITISETGKIGIGKTPAETIDTVGAITIGTTADTANDGTIRWNGTDFEGRKSGNWVSLTQGSFTDGIWQQPGGPNTDLIYFNPGNPAIPGHAKVGIGVSQTSYALQVKNNSSYDFDAPTILVTPNSTTTTSTHFRAGIQIDDGSVAWSTDANAPNVGLYVSNMRGQVNANANIAAALNGNVVIGDVKAPPCVGTNGVNVLAMQKGTPPSSAIGSGSIGGIQIYADDVTIAGGIMSALHFMNGDGIPITLFQQGPLEPANSLTVPNTGDANTDALIDNMRARINKLEEFLVNLGLLAEHP